MSCIIVLYFCDRISKDAHLSDDVLPLVHHYDPLLYPCYLTPCDHLHDNGTMSLHVVELSERLVGFFTFSCHGEMDIHLWNLT